MRVVTDAMREAATDAHPLAASRGRHAALQRIHSAAHYYRLMGQNSCTADRTALSERPGDRGVLRSRGLAVTR